MSGIEIFFSSLSNLLWEKWLLILLFGLGIFYTVITGGVQIFKMPFIVKNILLKPKDKKEDSNSNAISSSQALCTALASCVGSGNIVGVSTAILTGGAGALFWMWVAAFFGMATKFGEIVLGIYYREKDENGAYMGGPMYYIKKGLKKPWLAIVFAVLLFIQNAGGTLIQSNTIASVLGESFNVPKIATGITLALVMFFIISGGLKRLVLVAEKVVPIMAFLYVIGGIFIVLNYVDRLPEVLNSIFSSAFTLKARSGAIYGITIREAMRYGFARGLYSNEAGEGSAAVIHSTVEIDHPVRQGLYGVLEVFIDTMIICSTTGFVVLISGVAETNTNAATLVASAFGSVLPQLKYVVSISLVLFASTSLMSQWYFGHVSLSYLKLSKGSIMYKILFPFLIIYGSLSTVSLVWSIQDCALGLLVIPNIIALIILSPKVRKLTKEFFDPANGFIKTERCFHRSRVGLIFKN